MNTNNTSSSNSTVDSNDTYEILLGSLGGLAVLTNAPLLLVLLKRRTQTTPLFGSRMTYLVGNLALADCLTGVAVILSVLQATNYNLLMVWTTVEASYFTLLLVSIERFIVLAYPLTWPFILSARRTFLCIACIWLVSIACGIAVHIYALLVQFILTIVFEILVFAAIILHVIIFFHLQKRHRKFCERFCEISETRGNHINPADQSNATKVIIILLVILIVTVVPFMLVLQIIISHLLGFLELSNEGLELADKCYQYLYLLELVNFIVNPIVYAWRMKRYREAFQETFISILNIRPSSKDYDKAVRVVN